MDSVVVRERAARRVLLRGGVFAPAAIARAKATDREELEEIFTRQTLERGVVLVSR
jgi:hypothetical protein